MKRNLQFKAHCTLSYISLISLTIAVLLTGILFNSCKEDELVTLIIPTRVGFNSQTYVIEKDDTAPFKIDLAMPRPLEKDGTMIISVLDSSTADHTQYTTNPVVVDGKITINLKKGDTEASFTITSANNFLFDKMVAFKITSATGGLSLGNPELATVITLTGNRNLPALNLSVSSLPDFGSIEKGKSSPSQSYTVTGTDLTGNITLKASDNFEISLDDAAFASTLDIDFNDAQGVAKTIYVRFSPDGPTDDPITGTITNSTAEAEDVLVSVSGTQIIPKEVPLLNENFSYGAAAGDLVALSAGKWSAFSGTVNQVQYVTSGLTFPGYAGSNVDGAATMSNGSGSREDVTIDFTPQTSGTVYASMLVNVSRSNAGDFFFCTRDDNAGGYYNRLYAKDDGSGKLLFGIGRYSGPEYVTTPFNYNTTYLIVIKYDFAASTSSLYVIEGTPSETEPLVPTAVSSSSNIPATLNNACIRQGTGILDATIDGMRITKTWRGALGL